MRDCDLVKETIAANVVFNKIYESIRLKVGFHVLKPPSIRQDFCGSPFIGTAHAPQTSLPQPELHRQQEELAPDQQVTKWVSAKAADPWSSQSRDVLG
jgi:hypothetical protein